MQQEKRHVMQLTIEAEAWRNGAPAVWLTVNGRLLNKREYLTLTDEQYERVMNALDKAADVLAVRCGKMEER